MPNNNSDRFFLGAETYAKVREARDVQHRKRVQATFERGLRGMTVLLDARNQLLDEVMELMNINPTFASRAKHVYRDVSSVYGVPEDAKEALLEKTRNHLAEHVAKKMGKVKRVVRSILDELYLESDGALQTDK